MPIFTGKKYHLFLIQGNWVCCLGKQDAFEHEWNWDLVKLKVKALNVITTMHPCHLFSSVVCQRFF